MLHKYNFVVLDNIPSWKKKKLVILYSYKEEHQWTGKSKATRSKSTRSQVSFNKRKAITWNSLKGIFINCRFGNENRRKAQSDQSLKTWTKGNFLKDSKNNLPIFDQEEQTNIRICGNFQNLQTIRTIKSFQLIRASRLRDINWVK
jgi:hypothetical protein